MESGTSITGSPIVRSGKIPEMVGSGVWDIHWWGLESGTSIGVWDIHHRIPDREVGERSPRWWGLEWTWSGASITASFDP